VSEGREKGQRGIKIGTVGESFGGTGKVYQKTREKVRKTLKLTKQLKNIGIRTNGREK